MTYLTNMRHATVWHLVEYIGPTDFFFDPPAPGTRVFVALRNILTPKCPYTDCYNTRKEAETVIEEIRKLAEGVVTHQALRDRRNWKVLRYVHPF